MPKSLSSNARVIALVAGFFFATLGTLWSFLVTDNLSGEIPRLSDARADLTRQLDELSGLASDYFIANQMGDLIFVLAQQGSVNQDLAALIFQGNMLDRATPVRNMVGALALANQLDYAQTYGAYEQLNDETRANLSFENYARLKQVEAEIIIKGQERVPVLVSSIREIETTINAKQAEQSRIRVIGLIAAILGSALLLGANLLAELRRTGETTESVSK